MLAGGLFGVAMGQASNAGKKDVDYNSGKAVDACVDGNDLCIAVREV